MTIANNNDLVINARREREYKGYNLFDQIENPVLKAWNRAVLFISILGKHGRAASGEYLTLIPKEEKQKVIDTLEAMRNKGFSNIKREVIRDHVNA